MTKALGETIVHIQQRFAGYTDGSDGVKALCTSGMEPCNWVAVRSTVPGRPFLALTHADIDGEVIKTDVKEFVLASIRRGRLAGRPFEVLYGTKHDAYAPLDAKYEAQIPKDHIKEVGGICIKHPQDAGAVVVYLDPKTPKTDHGVVVSQGADIRWENVPGFQALEKEGQPYVVSVNTDMCATHDDAATRYKQNTGKEPPLLAWVPPAVWDNGDRGNDAQAECAEQLKAYRRMFEAKTHAELNGFMSRNPSRERVHSRPESAASQHGELILAMDSLSPQGSRSVSAASDRVSEGKVSHTSSAERMAMEIPFSSKAKTPEGSESETLVRQKAVSVDPGKKAMGEKLARDMLSLPAKSMFAAGLGHSRGGILLVVRRASRHGLSQVEQLAHAAPARRKTVLTVSSLARQDPAALPAEIKPKTSNSVARFKEMLRQASSASADTVPGRTPPGGPGLPTPPQQGRF